MTNLERNNLANQKVQKFQPNQFANDFIKSIQRQFGNIDTQSGIMGELIAEVYSQIQRDLKAAENGKNPEIKLVEICENGILDKEKFDILVLKYITGFNKEKNYECLKIENLTIPVLQTLLNSTLENSKNQPNSQIVENNLQILETEKMREKTTAQMLEKLKNHNFGSIDKTQILAFLEMLENMNMINFELNFENGGITINPEIALGENLGGLNNQEKKFYELMERFLDAKEIEKEVLGKINELKKSPDFSLAKRYAYETQYSQAQFLAPKINGIIKDSKLQDKFIEIIHKNVQENNAEEFDINYLLRATSGYRLAEYLFTTHNNGFETFDLNNLSLKNVLINQKNFETFIKSFREFAKIIEEKRNSRFGGHLQKENWSELGGVSLEELINLKRHLLDIETLIKEIETIRIGRKGGDEYVDFDNLEIDKFLDKIKGLKIIESKIWNRDKFKKVIFEVLHPVIGNLTPNEIIENERFLENIKEEKISSATLIKILHKFFLG